MQKYFGVLFMGKEKQSDIPRKVIKCLASAMIWELCTAGGPYGGFQKENLLLCSSHPVFQNLGVLNLRDDKRMARTFIQLDRFTQKENPNRLMVVYAFVTEDDFPSLAEHYPHFLRQPRLGRIVHL